ncbi:hypothetical protein [Pseudomonas aeruginosa]|uniref:hypothetical protein n=1 Tax=Pseudomonas aeruginosa TaxID=287 RepID=UPI001967A26B|nr:hypothetical protein KK186_00290 [Pseudomonas aeruginosa]
MHLCDIAVTLQIASIVGLGVLVADLAGEFPQRIGLVVEIAVETDLVQIAMAHQLVPHQGSHALPLCRAEAVPGQAVPEVVAADAGLDLARQVGEVALLQLHLALDVIAFVQR